MSLADYLGLILSPTAAPAIGDIPVRGPSGGWTTIPASGSAGFVLGLDPVTGLPGYFTPSFSGAAGGDLGGSYPNPTVPKVKGGKIPVAQTDAAGGDLSGTYPNPVVETRLVPITQAGAYTAQPWDLVIASGSPITLPTAPAVGTTIAVHAVSGNVVINAGGADVINRTGIVGASTTVYPNGTVTLVYSQSATWHSISDTDKRYNSFYARRFWNAAYTFAASSTWYALVPDVADGGNDAYFNASGQYVVPIAGHYQAAASFAVVTSANPTSMEVAVGRGGQERASSQVEALNGAWAATVTVRGTISCAAGDIITMYGIVGTAGLAKNNLASAPQGNFMEVYRIA